MAGEYEHARGPLDILNRRRQFGASGVQTAPDGTPVPPEQPVRFPDHYSPPEDATTFTFTSFFDSGGNDQNVPAGLQFQLPPDSEGVIRDFSRYINDMIATDAVVWQFRINGNPVPQWGNVTMFPRVVAFGASGDDPYILVPAGALLDILISNNTATAHKLGAGYYGWYWPNRKLGV
jgi:hypothetical protein